MLGWGPGDPNTAALRVTVSPPVWFGCSGSGSPGEMRARDMITFHPWSLNEDTV